MEHLGLRGPGGRTVEGRPPCAAVPRPGPSLPAVRRSRVAPSAYL